MERTDSLVNDVAETSCFISLPFQSASSWSRRKSPAIPWHVSTERLSVELLRDNCSLSGCVEPFSWPPRKGATLPRLPNIDLGVYIIPEVRLALRKTRASIRLTNFFQKNIVKYLSLFVETTVLLNRQILICQKIAWRSWMSVHPCEYSWVPSWLFTVTEESPYCKYSSEHPLISYISNLGLPLNSFGTEASCWSFWLCNTQLGLTKNMINTRVPKRR